MMQERAPVSRWSWIPMLVLGLVAWGTGLETRFVPVIGVTVVGAMLLLDRLVVPRGDASRVPSSSAAGAARGESGAAPSNAQGMGRITRLWWFPVAGVAVVVLVIDLDLARAASLVLLVFAVLLLLDRMLGRHDAQPEQGRLLARGLWIVLLLLAVAQWVLRLEWWVLALVVIAVALLDVAFGRPRRATARR